MPNNTIVWLNNSGWKYSYLFDIKVVIKNNFFGPISIWDYVAQAGCRIQTQKHDQFSNSWRNDIASEIPKTNYCLTNPHFHPLWLFFVSYFYRVCSRPVHKWFLSIMKLFYNKRNHWITETSSGYRTKFEFNQILSNRNLNGSVFNHNQTTWAMKLMQSVDKTL